MRESFLLLHDAGDYSLLAVLWSLHWEVVFSLALPLFLLAGWATRRFGWVAAVVVFALLYLQGSDEWFRYLPPFALGALLAFQHDRIGALRARLAGADDGRLAELGLLAVAARGAHRKLVATGRRLRAGGRQRRPGGQGVTGADRARGVRGTRGGARRPGDASRPLAARDAVGRHALVQPLPGARAGAGGRCIRGRAARRRCWC